MSELLMDPLTFYTIVVTLIGAFVGFCVGYCLGHAKGWARGWDCCKYHMQKWGY